MTSLNDIRATFLDYFGRHDHTIVDSAPLVPRNDPTLMFVNSGMVQFKNVFTGLEQRPYNRAASAQKCVRAGGKHNDLDNVGYTARHHTFFEMLGNFSFGDYFKPQAIAMAWELITRDFGIDKSRLVTTVYHTDDDAFEIWKKIGVPEERIIRIATSDNFWRMGPTGPCGPCTEIFYDHGAHIPGGPPGSAQEDGDRFIEIWNLVFMQNEQFEDGTTRALDMQSIDTGMGLERIGALLQGRHDNYDTDIFTALIEATAQATGVAPDADKVVHHRVIADHLRATAFLIADGVMPANEGRGYVLRRIMRRAMRHAHLLGTKDPLMHRLVPALAGQMGHHYSELLRAQALIAETLKTEEERFRATLDRGLRLLDDTLGTLPDGVDLPGQTAFKLYDTFGFPLDLTQDALRERGRGVDVAGFDAAMAAQRARARAAWTGSGDTANAALWFKLADTHGTTEFLGYGTEHAEAQVLALVVEETEETNDAAGRVRAIETAQTGDVVRVVVNQTPFYAQSGGQVGDCGVLQTQTGTLRVSDTQKAAGLHIHIGRVDSGTLSQDQSASLVVDCTHRAAVRANHTATHLLHEALRRTLGAHVVQRGSLNDASRLRFDFAHNGALGPEELDRIEAEVNTLIRQNAAVETRIVTPAQAQSMGAQALFGERYGEEVRMVAIGRCAGSGKGFGGDAYSLELCGGTHAARTGEIGVFVTVGESASAAGVRRIEALTGARALAHLKAQDRRLARAALALKSPGARVPDRIEALVEERAALRAEVAKLRQDLALAGGGGPQTPTHRQVGGVAFMARVLDGIAARKLPALIDEHKQGLGSGVVVLVSRSEGKAAVAAGVSADLTGRVSAIDLVRVAVASLGGRGGGGRPDMAQGGGPHAEGADRAIKAVERYLSGDQRPGS